MTRSWSIRAADASDAAAIAELIRLAFATQSRPTHPPPSALKETAASVLEHLDGGGGAVIDDGGIIVGAVLWNEDAGGLYIGRLSVDPDHRRRVSLARSCTKPSTRRVVRASRASG